jgi:hypothetical protein
MLKADRVLSTPQVAIPEILPPSAAKVKRRLTPPVRPLVDVDTFPDVYGMLLEGDCLEPLLPNGAQVVIQKSAVYAVGDIVCVWWKPEFVKPGMYQCWIKRLTMAIPPLVKFPYNDHPKSEVKALAMFEQLNPQRGYGVTCEHIHAIHKAVAYAPPSNAKTVRSDRLLPIGDGVVPQLA